MHTHALLWAAMLKYLEHPTLIFCTFTSECNFFTILMVQTSLVISCQLTPFPTSISHKGSFHSVASCLLLGYTPSPPFQALSEHLISFSLLVYLPSPT